MKKLYSRSLIVVGVATILFGVVIFVFGDKGGLNTEIPPLAPLLRSESLPVGDTIEGENLTDAFSKTLAKRIIEQNQSGPETIEGTEWLTVDDPEKLVDELLEKELANFDLASIYPTADVRKIKVDENTSITVQSEYFKSFYSIFSSSFKGLSINREQPEKTNFPDIIAAFRKAEAAFYELSVPRPLLDFHTREIVLLGAQANIFIMMRDYQTDPVRALVAAYAGDQVTERVITLLNEINAYMEANNITI